MIRKLLVANRGEIALRIMRTCKEMGIKTVAVFSEADRYALHTRFADEAYCIGPAPSAESYLLGHKIIEVAKQCGADAIHPGYGFLSENALFSKAVDDAGLLFVGPSAASIEVMGSKIGAKQAVGKFNIPLVPGMDKAIADVAEAKAIAQQIGYPVLLKASAGGGGKGMRVVENEAEFEEQMNRAMGEASAAFGDPSVFIEKFIAAPKHIEVQIFGDKHGNVVHLFERECSVQRRHQKLVEEAPSSCLSPAQRMAIGADAVKVAQACGYYGAGTVEFIADKDLNYYFLEMNTRLQVEHPVTEMITGIDLVRWQILVAQGEALPLKQEEITWRGHAIELRVCAENPTENFLPETGTLHTYQRPQGAGIRVDDGMEEGQEIPIFYDPMIAKLVVWAEDRPLAIAKMKRAIAEYKISGVSTTLGFGEFVMNHPDFTEGHFDTHFVAKNFRPESLIAKFDQEELEVLAKVAGLHFSGNQKSNLASQRQATAKVSQWRRRAKV